MNLDSYDKVLFFPSVHWSHNWERQHELIYRFSESTKTEVHIILPLGYLNHNILKVIWKVVGALKKRFHPVPNSSPTLDNMSFITVNYIPFHFFGPIDLINYYLLKKRLNIRPTDKIFLWTTYINGSIIELQKKCNITIIDLAVRRQIIPQIPETYKKAEAEAIKTADLIFVDNQYTVNDYNELNKNIYYCPQGVDVDKFDKSEVAPEYSYLAKRDSKIIGYCGALHQYINYDYITFLIQELNKCTFIFVGNIVDKRAEQLMRFNNVFFAGRKKHNQLYQYYNCFDVGLIPYTIEPFTTGVFPTKMFEYAACGVPIVSSALPDLVNYDYPFLKIYRTYKELKEHVSNIMNQKEVYKADLKGFARKNSWEKRFELISQKIKQVL